VIREMPMKLLRAGLSLVGALLLAALCPLALSARDQPTPLAIVDFDYNDTSGEPADQNAIHQSRLKAFMQAIRSDLAASGKFSLVALSCGSDPCSITQTPSAEILDKARQAGARLLLFGGIHKMSTLIQWAKIQAVDLKTEKLVFDRLLTFRGDTDDAWKRAEAFVAEQMTTLDVEK
jgi:Tol biopolymer transport system component